jgi:hypothetical protein
MPGRGAGYVPARRPCGLNFHVPKLNLVSRLQALLHNGQLKIHKGLADAGALV